MSPHGTRSRFNNAGCRCLPCLNAQRKYQREWNASRRAGIQRLVSGHAVRLHMHKLFRQGLTIQDISDATGISLGILSHYSSGYRKRLKPEREAIILAVTENERNCRKLQPIRPYQPRLKFEPVMSWAGAINGFLRKAKAA